jgi:hypothetical protein
MNEFLTMIGCLVRCLAKYSTTPQVAIIELFKAKFNRGFVSTWFL